MDGYSLKLQPYCKNCPEFDVVVDVDEDARLNAYDFTRGPFKDKTPTKMIFRIITCSHVKRCENLIRYLKEKTNENKE